MRGHVEKVSLCCEQMNANMHVGKGFTTWEQFPWPREHIQTSDPREQKPHLFSAGMKKLLVKVSFDEFYPFPLSQQGYI